MCCLLSLTWIATSSIICRRIRWAPPLKLVITASPDTISLRSAQMYWNLRWFLTDDLKSNLLTASPSPLKPAISFVQRRTIWQWGGGTDSIWMVSSECCPSVAFLKVKKFIFVVLSPLIRIDFSISYIVKNILTFLDQLYNFLPLCFAFKHFQLLPIAFFCLHPFLAIWSPIFRYKRHC